MLKYYLTVEVCDPASLKLRGGERNNDAMKNKAGVSYISKKELLSFGPQ
jgi:hypothetical protein